MKFNSPKKDIKLFLDEEGDTKRYYTSDEVRCDECLKMIDNIMFHYTYFLWRPPKQETYCFKCNDCLIKTFAFKKYLESYRGERRMVTITDLIPSSAQPFFISKTVVTNARDVTVFEPEKILSEKTNDLTVHAGRESWVGAKIGRDVTAELEKKEAPADDAEFDKIMFAQPYKEIENKEETKKIDKK